MIINKKIMIIAAHPDDEILGCGGTIARLVSEGHQVYIFILAEGITSRNVIRNREVFENELLGLKKIAIQANNILGVSEVELLDFPDNRMDNVDRLDIIKIIEKKILEIQPAVIYTHFYNDLNIDHRIVSDAVITATRPVFGQCVKEIYFFEVPSSTEWQFGNQSERFNPNVFSTLTDFQFEKKMEALHIYESEMREYPHPRSYKGVEILNQFRGLMVGVRYAESFISGRIIY